MLKASQLQEHYRRMLMFWVSKSSGLGIFDKPNNAAVSGTRQTQIQILLGRHT